METTEGKKLNKNISGMMNVLLWVAFSAIGIYIAVGLWVAFKPAFQNAVHGNKLAGCNYALPGLPGVYCQGHENGSVFYYNSKIKVSIK